MNALSSKRPKEVWKTINRTPMILVKTPMTRIGTSHLRLNVSQLLFQLTWGICRAGSMGSSQIMTFHFRQVTHDQVLREIKGLRSDCSTGPDDIPPILLNLSQSIWHLLLHILSTLVFQTRIIVMIIIIITTVYTQFQSRLELRWKHKSSHHVKCVRTVANQEFQTNISNLHSEHSNYVVFSE